MALTFLDILDRTLSGPIYKVKDWDFSIIPSKVKGVLQAHGLEKTYDPDNPINTDDGLADDFWKAGFDLALETGMYCPETERVIKFTKEELDSALRDAPSEAVVGRGKDAVKIKTRCPEDKIQTVPAMSCLGLPVSEELFVPIAQSVVQYPVVDVTAGLILQTIDGREVRGKSPYETFAAVREAILMRKALDGVGRSGMPVFGVEGSPTEYGQLGGLGTKYGYDPECTIAVTITPEPFKLPYPVLHKLAQAINCKAPIEAGHMCTIGGYFGSPEMAAVGAIAAQILQVASMQPTVVDSTVLDRRYLGNCGNSALWATSINKQARSRNTHVMDLGLAHEVSGPCTDMVLYETATICIADAVSGAAMVLGTTPCGGRYPNYGSGIENKFGAEVLKVSAGLKRDHANEIVKAILPKFENRLKNPPKGKSFTECTNAKTLQPTKEWLEIYDNVWKELEDLGLSRPSL